MQQDKWTAKDVADRFEEAVKTLRRLPSVRVQGYFNLWPAMRYTQQEMWAMEKQPMRLGPPSAVAISRMEQTIGWIAWIDDADDRKIVWLRAENVRWRKISACFGFDRKTAWRHWVAALMIIADKLNRAGVQCIRD